MWLALSSESDKLLSLAVKMFLKDHRGNFSNEGRGTLSYCHTHTDQQATFVLS